EGDEHVERDRARHEEDAVVAGLLDDAADEPRRGGESGENTWPSRAEAGGGRGRWRVDAVRRRRAVRRRPFELCHVRQGIRTPRGGSSARSRPATRSGTHGAELQEAGPGSSETSTGFTTSSPAARGRGGRSPSASRVSRIPRSIAAR